MVLVSVNVRENRKGNGKDKEKTKSIHLVTRRAQAVGLVTMSSKSSHGTSRTHSSTDRDISEDMGVHYGGPINSDEDTEGAKEKASMHG